MPRGMGVGCSTLAESTRPGREEVDCTITMAFGVAVGGRTTDSTMSLRSMDTRVTRVVGLGTIVTVRKSL